MWAEAAIHQFRESISHPPVRPTISPTTVGPHRLGIRSKQSDHFFMTKIMMASGQTTVTTVLIMIMMLFDLPHTTHLGGWCGGGS
jgi:hypothetical protein